eukprot:IDg11052t1
MRAQWERTEMRALPRVRRASNRARAGGETTLFISIPVLTTAAAPPERALVPAAAAVLLHAPPRTLLKRADAIGARARVRWRVAVGVNTCAARRRVARTHARTRCALIDCDMRHKDDAFTERARTLQSTWTASPVALTSLLLLRVGKGADALPLRSDCANAVVVSLSAGKGTLRPSRLCFTAVLACLELWLRASLCQLTSCSLLAGCPSRSPKAYKAVLYMSHTGLTQRGANIYVTAAQRSRHSLSRMSDLSCRTALVLRFLHVSARYFRLRVAMVLYRTRARACPQQHVSAAAPYHAQCPTKTCTFSNEYEGTGGPQSNERTVAYDLVHTGWRAEVLGVRFAVGACVGAALITSAAVAPASCVERGLLTAS